jgi:hypothetical protein
MKVLLIFLALFVAQQNSVQDRTVVHLRPHRNTIENDFGGKLLELINAPTLVNLPTSPPRLDSEGKPWSIDVKNLGPGAVTVAGKGEFSSKIDVGRTVHIAWNGSAYSLKR